MNKNISRRKGLQLMAAGSVAALSSSLFASGKTVDHKTTFDGGWQDTEGKNKHQPVVTVGKRNGDEVEICVEVKHPMSANHYIESIRVYDADRKLISKQELSPLQSTPKAVFFIKVSLGTELIALSECNLHGLWKRDFKV